MEKGEEDFGKISKMIQKEIAKFEVRNRMIDLPLTSLLRAFEMFYST